MIGLIEFGEGTHRMLSSQASQIIIIAGPNGAGKTTLAPYLLRDWLGLLEYVNADTIWIVYDNSSLSQPLKLATGEQAVENVIEPALWDEFYEVAK